MDKIGKHINFTEDLGWEGKTKKWFVRSRHSNALIGKIIWYGAWRQYVLDPFPQTIWSHDCLAEVAEFIKQRMEERKKQ